MNEPLYPLRFRPIYQNYPWGGRRFESFLQRVLGPEEHYAESWEVSDVEGFSSVVENGPLAGRTLRELMAARRDELLGEHPPQSSSAPLQGRFPLLLKYLDARESLSVQVHPDDARAAQLDPPDLGKTEAWVVLAAEPGSKIYAGLRPGVGPEDLAEAIRRGTCQELLHRLEPGPGECVLLPAGTVHALGAGLLVAEIQRTSNTTYRLYDWNRLGRDGKPRPLHIEQGLEAVDFGRDPVEPQRPQPTGRSGVTRLVTCDKFVLDRWQLDAAASAGGDRRCHILTVLEGGLQMPADPSGQVLPRGRTVLLPAASGAVELIPQGNTLLLDAYLP